MDGFESEDDITCAFCGKRPGQVAAMISGPNGIYICDECISVCADAMMRDLGLPVASMQPEPEAEPAGRHARRARVGLHLRASPPLPQRLHAAQTQRASRGAGNDRAVIHPSLHTANPGHRAAPAGR